MDSGRSGVDGYGAGAYQKMWRPMTREAESERFPRPDMATGIVAKFAAPAACPTRKEQVCSVPTSVGFGETSTGVIRLSLSTRHVRAHATEELISFPPALERRRTNVKYPDLARPHTRWNYQGFLPWQELAQLRLVAFQPLLASTSLIPLLCEAEFTVVEL